MKKNYTLLLLLLLLCTSNTILAQVNIDETLKQYHKNYLPEKVFVHTDKNIYAAGETVWMAVYLIDAERHTTEAISLVVRLELQNQKGESFLSQKLYAEGGHMNSEMTLPADIKPGNYQLTAYTNYQRNSEAFTLFRKVIHVVPGIGKKERVAAVVPEIVPLAKTVSLKEQEEVKLQFFPEGGNCVNSINCRMSVVAENAKGKPIQVKGRILDELGQKILTLDTDEFGIGNFVYVPKADKQYKVVLDGNKSEFEFPSALELGYHLSIGRRDASVVISLQTNNEVGLNNATILIRLRGEPIYIKKLALDNKSYILKLPTESLLPGIYVVTLFDGKDNPTAERLFFIAPDKNDFIEIQTDTLKLKTQQAVDLNLRFASDFVAEKYTGRMSLSVIPTMANMPTKNDEITTWLLLNSDIDQPLPFSTEFIMTDNSSTNNNQIDDFLRTRYWRRFAWTKKEDFKPKFQVEKGIYLKGNIGDTTQQEQNVVLTRYKNNFVEETTTDEAGNFIFGPYEFSDTLDFLLQGNFDINKTATTAINLKDYEVPFVPFDDDTENIDDAEKKYKTLSHKALKTAYTYDSLAVQLDSTQQKMLSKGKEQSHAKLYNDRPDIRVELDTMAYLEKMTSVLDVLKRIPGVIGTGEEGAEKFQVRGTSTKPTYYVNGFKSQLDDLRKLPLAEVKLIDVIRGPKVAAFGSLGENGVVLVYTKDEKPVSGMLYSKMQGFHKDREFAVFDSEWLSDQKLSDIRTTLHWNPDLRTDDKGKVKETFTTSDQTGEFIIIAQGLRDDGTPFYGTKKIVVED